MSESEDYVFEIFNKEITKLRKELYESYQRDLIVQFGPKDIEMGWNYFSAYPVMDSLNLKSLDMIVEYCKIAKEYRESKDK